MYDILDARAILTLGMLEPRSAWATSKFRPNPIPLLSRPDSSRERDDG